MILFATRDKPCSLEEQREIACGLLEKALLYRGMTRREMAMDYSPLGKPFFPDYPDLHFNLSHCPTAVVVGIGKRPLGVDVEKIRPFSRGAVQIALSDRERELLRRCAAPDLYGFSLWVLKESMIKLRAGRAGHAMRNHCFESLFLSNLLGVSPKIRPLYLSLQKKEQSVLYRIGDHLLGVSEEISNELAYE